MSVINVGPIDDDAAKFSKRLAIAVLEFRKALAAAPAAVVTMADLEWLRFQALAMIDYTYQDCVVYSHESAEAVSDRARAVAIFDALAVIVAALPGSSQ